MINVRIPVDIRSRTVRVARDARWIAAAAAVAAAAAGFAWGTYVAGGSDSYCYLSQAELFAAGHIVNIQAVAAIAPWEHAAKAFVPVGHVPAFSPAGATVPMCPPGYPMLMALARTVGGRAAMFAVVPLLGALAVWSTFVLGRRIAGPAAGGLAALLLAASPPFLYQIIQPMSDVPASAMWAVSLVAITDRRFTSSTRGAVLGGIATGAALLIRPNLVPVAVVAALAVFIERPVRWRDVLRTWTMFGAGILPFALTVAALQNTMSGGPLKSGHGDLDFLFRIDHVWPNLQRYPRGFSRLKHPSSSARWRRRGSSAARDCGDSVSGCLDSSRRYLPATFPTKSSTRGGTCVSCCQHILHSLC
jgi:hypothetical protein